MLCWGGPVQRLEEGALRGGDSGCGNVICRQRVLGARACTSVVMVWLRRGIDVCMGES